MRVPAVLCCLLLAVPAPAPAGEDEPVCARLVRLDVVDVKGPARTNYGYGHEFAIEVEFDGTPAQIARTRLEWWEYVSYDRSAWFSEHVHAVPAIRVHTWQDQLRVNPDSPMWAFWREGRAQGRRVLRIVDKPSIPLGNVRLGAAGREYSNLARRLWIEVTVHCGCPGANHAARSVWVFQSLSEKEGTPTGALLSSGPSRIRADELLALR